MECIMTTLVYTEKFEIFVSSRKRLSKARSMDFYGNTCQFEWEAIGTV